MYGNLFTLLPELFHVQLKHLVSFYAIVKRSAKEEGRKVQKFVQLQVLYSCFMI